MRKQIHTWLRVSMAIFVVATLVLAGCSTSRPTATPIPASSSAPTGAPQEGIKVHGHWTLEVRNPDGSLAEHREFENEYEGKWTIAKFLARQDSVGGWRIVIEDWMFHDHPFLDGSSPHEGYIVESSHTATDAYYFKNLTVTTPHDAGDPNWCKLVLSGTATAQRDGKINCVYTNVVGLAPHLPPSSSYDGNFIVFTSTYLDTPVNLSNGQQIAVTVVISFS